MAKYAGRDLKLYSGTPPSGTIIAGGRAHDVKINNASIDITDKGSNGWRELMEKSGMRSVDISFSGLMDGTTVVALALGSDASAMLASYYVELAGVGTISGDFRLEEVTLGTPHDDAVEMSGELRSHGAITWTPAA